MLRLYPLLTLLCLIPTFVHAQGKLNSFVGNSREEQLFLMFALEDLYRDLKFSPDERSIKTVAEMQRAFNYQHKIVDQLRSHCENRNFSVLHEQLTHYKKLLDLFKNLTEKMREREKEYLYPLEKVYSLFLGNRTGRQVSTAQTSMRIGLQGLLNDAPLEGAFMGLAHQMFMSQLNLGFDNIEWRRAVRAAKDYERRERPIYERDIIDIQKAFIKEFTPLRLLSIKVAHEAFKKHMVEVLNFTTEQVQFDPDAILTNPARDRDPFRTKAEILATANPEQLKDYDDHLKQAEKCLEMTKYIPNSSETKNANMYNHYRAQFCALAGMHALRVAQHQVGEGGFTEALKPNKRPKAAGVALRAWNLYKTCAAADEDKRSAVEFCLLQAQAYNGDIVTAYNKAKSMSVNKISMPEFWWVSARLASLNGQTKDCLYCLQLAVDLGYRDLDKAKTNPDFAKIIKLRQADFERILQDQ
jgi:hypothetical protein